MQQIGAELQCLSLAGYDATTFGNHDFGFGPAVLANAVAAAHKAGRVPAILANTNFDGRRAGCRTGRLMRALRVMLAKVFG